MFEVAFLAALAALVAGNVVARINVGPLMSADGLHAAHIGD